MDGESLVNRGMRLSPREPPRFVLAAIHGICGLQPELDGITFKPSIPKHWKWAGLRRFPHRGHELAFFGAVQQDGNHLYGIIGDVSSSQAQKHAYDEGVTAHVYSRNMQAQHLAFRRPGEQAA